MDVNENAYCQNDGGVWTCIASKLRSYKEGQLRPILDDYPFELAALDGSGVTRP